MVFHGAPAPPVYVRFSPGGLIVVVAAAALSTHDPNLVLTFNGYSRYRPAFQECFRRPLVFEGGLGI